MIVDRFRREVEAGAYEISARMRPEGADAQELRLWFRFPERFAPPGDLDASPFLPPALAWCLRRGERLVIEGPVSPRLLGELDEIMGVYRSFFPGAISGPVAVEAQPCEPSAGSELTASFFTRGVDSWFGVLTALDDPTLAPPLTHAVYAPGFNSRAWSDELRDAKTEATREAAARVGLELIRLDSNISDEFGRGLFGAALALGFANMLIPSGNMRGEIVRQGTHPHLDPRFSTERTEILHYGDASRLQKVERLARSEAALDTIRVCRYDHLEGDRNCGHCEKCLRTMLELHVAGALERSPAFDEPLRLSNVAAVKKLQTVRHSWLEIQNALGDSPQDRRLSAAVRMVIFRNDLRFAAERAQRLSGRLDLAEALGDSAVLAESADALWEVDARVQRLMEGMAREEGRGYGADGDRDARPSAAGPARRAGLLTRLRSRS